MRFLMLNWRDPFNPMAGGAERVTLGYLEGLVERGHAVWWFAHAFPGADREHTLRGVRIVRGGGMGTSVVQARRWCGRQPRFDLVIDQHHGIPWYAPWWCRTRCVAYIHEVLGPIWDAFYSWPWNVLGRWQERWTHRLYRRVPFWTASAATRRMLEDHGVRDVTLIPYGVETEALAELGPKPLAEPLKLIVVSRLAPNKRVDHALRTLAVLRKQEIEASLIVVGSGVEEGRLRRLATELSLNPWTTFAGALPEEKKDRRLQEAHFLLHHSQREGWGLNVIEANAMGTPAVVYPTPGLVESTLHNQTGLVTEAETPESMAAALKRALDEPGRYSELRRRAWERSREFHWNAVRPRACEWLEEQAQRPFSKS